MKQNYDPKKVNAIAAGIVLTGFSEGTFISGERTTEKRTFAVGAKGDVTVNKSADDTGTITLTLKQTSPSNSVLLTLYNQDKSFPFAVIDANFSGDVGLIGGQCYVQNLPTQSWAGEEETREWTLMSVSYDNTFAVVGEAVDNLSGLE